MGEFPEFVQIKIGLYADMLVKWLIQNFQGFFDGLSDGILWTLLKIQGFLIWIPWYIVLIGVLILGWKVKNIKSGIIYTLMIFIIGALGLWDEMMLTFAIVLISVTLAIFIGIPIGIVAAYNRKIEAFIKPVLDTMQTMPSFVYLIPAVMLFGLGTVPAVLATIIYATPPVLRLTSLAIHGVSVEMKEAANSFGSSMWQTLIKVELPQAFPTIMTGINQTTMMAMSMVVVASMIGAKGLGLNVLTAVSRLDIAMGAEAGLGIVLLAIVIDRITQGIANNFKYKQQNR
jgi:glycine betaine/proline transport system permease protein